MSGIALGLSAMLTLALGNSGLAESAKPQNTVFKSWTLACVTPQPAQGSTAKPKATCRIFHQVHPESDATKIAFIAAACYVGPDRIPMMILTLPPAASLQRGLNFVVGQGLAYKANILVCTQHSCISQFKLTDDLLKLFRTGTQAIFAFGLNPQGQATYAVPLAGFATALDELQKTGF